MTGLCATPVHSRWPARGPGTGLIDRPGAMGPAARPWRASPPLGCRAAWRCPQRCRWLHPARRPRCRARKADSSCAAIPRSSEHRATPRLQQEWLRRSPLGRSRRQANPEALHPDSARRKYRVQAAQGASRGKGWVSRVAPQAGEIAPRVGAIGSATQTPHGRRTRGSEQYVEKCRKGDVRRHRIDQRVRHWHGHARWTVRPHRSWTRTRCRRCT